MVVNLSESEWCCKATPEVPCRTQGFSQNFTIRVMILLGQRMEGFFNLAFARSNVHTSDVDWVYY